ncbi:hypothetical protein ACSBR2_010565 [Camellia fascicularis]
MKLLGDFSGEPELDPDLTDKRFEQGESSSGQRRSGEDRVDRCVPGGRAECDPPEDRTAEIGQREDGEDAEREAFCDGDEFEGDGEEM